MEYLGYLIPILAGWLVLLCIFDPTRSGSAKSQRVATPADNLEDSKNATDPS